MRVRELTGRPILDTSSAESVGRIEAPILDPAASRVVGFRVSGSSPVLGLDDVRSVGADAVTVDDRAALRQPRTDLETEAASRPLDPVGARVLSDAGAVLGVAQDLDVEPDGDVRAVITDGGEIPGDHIVGFGGYALVVRVER